ncbi:MAG: 23S rRNA (uracil(1939)-C(5))-methyltransferase RlmD [Bacilli bacterium]|nr:23S rRNA (uracil(1939)-C(5))-methyltransferase RlmD [Bacilli bacterium]
MEEIIVKEPREKIIKVGEKFKVQFVSMTHDARGVCKLNGKNKYNEELVNFPIFVNNAITNEEGIVELTEVKKTLGNAKIVKIFKDKTSPYRIEAICPIYSECGGCHLMHMNYEGQLKFKRSMVKQTLEKIGGFKELKVSQVIPSVDTVKYRNKVQIPFGSKKNKTICGFYKNQTHEIIPIEECFIQSDEMTEIVKFIRNLCNEFRIKGYDEEKGTGDIRHVLVRESTSTNEIMVVLVTLRKDIKNINELVTKLVNRHPKIVSVINNVNDEKTNVVLGKKSYKLYGKNYIEDILLGNKFRIGERSFYQVNPKTTEVLYQKAISLAKFKPTDNIIDAYCGIGTIGISAAKYVNHVYSVEIVEEAIKNAFDNAKINNINNIDFVCGKAEEQIVTWKKEGLQIDAIIVDPPRKGLDIKLMDTINEMDIKKVVYISCDISTLARDLKHFKELGYNFTTVYPVDMFPNTMHVENIVLITKE